VAVQQHPADAGLGGDVVQAGGGEPGAGERLGGGGQQLLAALGPAQPPHRGGRGGLGRGLVGAFWLDEAIVKVEGLVKVFAGKVPVRAYRRTLS
jgi:hypothetical protein